MKENIDYEIVPSHEDEQAWNVRILTGLFTESVLKYGVVKFNGKGKDKYMSFNFDIVYTPDTELTKESVELQEFAGDMLEQIMARGIEQGTVISREVKDEDKSN